MTKRKSRSVFGRVFQRKGRPGWYLRVRIHGRETERYAGPDRKTAHEVLGQLLQVHSRQELLGEKPVASVALDRVVGEFRDYLRAKHAASTFAAESLRLNDIVERFGSVALRDVDAGMIADFITDLRITRNLSAATANRYQSLLSSLFRYAVDRSLARENPVSGLPRAKEDQLAVGFISDSDVDRLVAAAGDPSYGAFLRVLADAGLRRSEALALAWRDVDFQRRELLVRRSKTHRPRAVPMTPEVESGLRALRDGKRVLPLIGTDPVWPDLAALHPSSVSSRLKAVASRAGLPPLRLHDLRHGFCSRLAQRGVPLPTVAALAGHTSIQTTMRYARHMPNDASRVAIDALARPRSDGNARATGT